MRTISACVSCLLPLLVGALVAAEDSSPGYSMSDHLVVRVGKKVSGHIGACLMNRGGKPVALFGMTKELDEPGRYTFFVLFKTGGKKLDASGIGGMVESDGKTTKSKQNFDLGPFDLTITAETVRDAKTMAIVSSKTLIGDKELVDKGPRVLLVDLTGEKPAYKLIQANLPTSVPDLGDEDENTWPAALDAAIKELKAKSAELKPAD